MQKLYTLIIKIILIYRINPVIVLAVVVNVCCFKHYDVEIQPLTCIIQNLGEQHMINEDDMSTKKEELKHIKFVKREVSLASPLRGIFKLEDFQQAQKGEIERKEQELRKENDNDNLRVTLR